jgi:uncharacterized membrane protein YraQ (UPF0718 family)
LCYFIIQEKFASFEKEVMQPKKNVITYIVIGVAIVAGAFLFFRQNEDS